MRSKSSRILRAAIRSELAPVLRADGFYGSGPTFRRYRGELIHIVQVQESDSGVRFAVNLGAHLAFLPAMLNVRVPPWMLSLEECEWRDRMSETSQDRWWSFSDDPERIRAAVRDAVSVWRSHGRPRIERLGRYPDDFAHLTATDLDEGRITVGGFGSNKMLMALAFARIRLHEGNRVEAARFAEVGLLELARRKANTGLGTRRDPYDPLIVRVMVRLWGPRRNFERILNAVRAR